MPIRINPDTLKATGHTVEDQRLQLANFIQSLRTTQQQLQINSIRCASNELENAINICSQTESQLGNFGRETEAALRRYYEFLDNPLPLPPVLPTAREIWRVQYEPTIIGQTPQLPDLDSTVLYEISPSLNFQPNPIIIFRPYFQTAPRSNFWTAWRDTILQHFHQLTQAHKQQFAVSNAPFEGYAPKVQELPGRLDSFADIMTILEKIPDDKRIGIYKAIGKDGRAQYYVFLKGTRGINEYQNSEGWSSALGTGLNNETDFTKDVEKAMREAGIDPNDPNIDVHMFGHSQGGLGAFVIAKDGDWKNIRTITSFGAGKPATTNRNIQYNVFNASSDIVDGLRHRHILSMVTEPASGVFAELIKSIKSNVHVYTINSSYTDGVEAHGSYFNVNASDSDKYNRNDLNKMNLRDYTVGLDNALDVDLYATNNDNGFYEANSWGFTHILDRVVDGGIWLWNNVASPAGSFIIEKARDGTKFIIEKVGAGANWLKDRIGDVWNAFRGGLKDTSNWLRDRLAHTLAAAKAIAQWLEVRLKGGLQWIGDRMHESYNFIKDKVVEGGHWVKDKLGTGWHWLQDTGRNFINGVGSTFNNIWNFVTGNNNDPGPNLLKSLGNIVNYAQQGYNYAHNLLQRLDLPGGFSKMGHFFGEVGQDVWNFIGTFPARIRAAIAAPMQSYINNIPPGESRTLYLKSVLELSAKFSGRIDMSKGITLERDSDPNSPYVTVEMTAYGAAGGGLGYDKKGVHASVGAQLEGEYKLKLKLDKNNTDHMILLSLLMLGEALPDGMRLLLKGLLEKALEDNIESREIMVGTNIYASGGVEAGEGFSIGADATAKLHLQRSYIMPGQGAGSQNYFRDRVAFDLEVNAEASLGHNLGKSGEASVAGVRLSSNFEISANIEYKPGTVPSPENINTLEFKVKLEVLYSANGLSEVMKAQLREIGFNQAQIDLLDAEIKKTGMSLDGGKVAVELGLAVDPKTLNSADFQNLPANFSKMVREAEVEYKIEAGAARTVKFGVDAGVRLEVEAGEVSQKTLCEGHFTLGEATDRLKAGAVQTIDNITTNALNAGIGFGIDKAQSAAEEILKPKPPTLRLQ